MKGTCGFEKEGSPQYLSYRRTETSVGRKNEVVKVCQASIPPAPLQIICLGHL